MIAALPDAITVTLADKEVIEAARAAYNSLPNEAQKSLVDITRLKDAETILNSYVVDPPETDSTDSADDNNDGCGSCGSVIGGTSLGGVALGAVAMFVMRKHRRKENSDITESTENSEE
jgi:hypothetical protein